MRTLRLSPSSTARRFAPRIATSHDSPASSFATRWAHRAARSADDFESGTLAAACGGTTCVVDFAGAGRESPEMALRVWHEKAAGRAAIDYGFHLTVTTVPSDPEEARRLFAWMVSQGVTSVKLYMAYPERLMVDDDTLSRAFAAGAATGVRVSIHAEDG